MWWDFRSIEIESIKYMESHLRLDQELLMDRNVEAT